MKRPFIGIVLTVCLVSLVLGGCGSSSPSHEGMIRYNGQWITVEEYERIESGELPSPSDGQSSTSNSIGVTTDNTSTGSESFKASCISISYDSLARNTESYVGQHVYFRGEVIQVGELGSDLYYLRIAVTKTEYDWYDAGDVVWVNYLGPRVLEEDIVDFWGVVEGRKSYTAVLGNEITIPEVTALYLELATPGVSPEPEEEVNLSASFEITDWEQAYYEYSEEWGDYVEIYYEIENTGDVEIDYYKVYFTVECRGGKEYYDWTNGSGVGVGKKLSDNTLIDVGGREVRHVEITDWELESY